MGGGVQKIDVSYSLLSHGPENSMRPYICSSQWSTLVDSNLHTSVCKVATLPMCFEHCAFDNEWIICSILHSSQTAIVFCMCIKCCAQSDSVSP